MKMLAVPIAIAALISASAGAQETPPPSKPRQICLQPFGTPPGLIDHTHAVDANTVLFYMKNGDVWKNTLKGPCPGLLYHGFSFVSRYTEVCANATAIQVIVTGEVCQLGDFTPLRPGQSHIGT
jgi:hypothetical protein